MAECMHAVIQNILTEVSSVELRVSLTVLTEAAPGPWIRKSEDHKGQAFLFVEITPKPPPPPLPVREHLLVVLLEEEGTVIQLDSLRVHMYVRDDSSFSEPRRII